MGLPRWAIFISGRGSNLQSVLDLMGRNHVVLCVTSKSKAIGVLRARRMGIPVFTFKKDWEELHRQLLIRKIDYIFLLGFMKLVPAEFVKRWEKRIFNLHPSLLPKFPGLEAIEKSYQANEAMGVTVHEVVAMMDAGPVILQSAICGQQQAWQQPLSRRTLQIAACEQKLVRRFIEGTRKSDRKGVRR